MTNYEYDAFISHNGADKPSVERIAAALQAQGLDCYLDKWDILPGDQWLENLANGLIKSRTILIFIGTHGIGPYQREEVDAALRRKVEQRQNCVIPVLLLGASPEDIAKFSIFLQGTHALRFYDLDDPLPHRLLAGLVRGEDPNHLRQLIRDTAHAPADLLQMLNQWLSGLRIEWREDECQISEGMGQRCLNIADLSDSFNPDSIEYLLSWKSQLTGLLGREQELKVLHDWADAKTEISVRLIVGEGGTGKTRLAFEFARELKQRKNWQAGEAQGLAGCWYTGSSGTLLVIDYPEQRPEKVTALLEALANQPPKKKLRVLLLGRNGDFLNQLTLTAQAIVAPHLRLEGLTNDSAAWELFQQAWLQLHIRKPAAVPAVPPLPMAQETFAQWQQKNTAHGRPLFVLALAVRLELDPDAQALNAQAIIRTLTQQFEINRLIKEAQKNNFNAFSLVMLRALAVLSGRLESQALRDLIQASATLQLDIQLPTLPQLKQTSLWERKERGAIPALQPDLLAADLLHYALTELADDQSDIWQYLGLEAATNTAEASSILGRVIYDARSILNHTWPMKTLIDCVVHEPQRCQKISDALNRDYLEHTLLPLAIATDQALLEHTDSPPVKAVYLNNLSNRLAQAGDRAAGLAAIQRAVEIYEQLAKDNFAAYGPDLASSLNNLSNCLAQAGERAKGLAAIQRAVQICEQLAKDNFAAYGPDLAMSLNNLSVRLAEAGERAKGLAAIQRAVEIREQLAKDNFAAYGPVLAQSLNNLSIRLAQAGERAKGLAAIQRAVEIYEQLAKDNFAAYGPDLAMSLNNLSIDLAEAGERAKGLAAIQRAVEIREQLAKDNFAAYGPVLAQSLNNLSIDLAEAGERAKGLAAIQRAVEIYEQLAKDNFAAYGPDLAASLNNLSIDLAEAGERAKGLAAIQRAVEIREQLAKDNFAAYGPDLAASLNNLSNRLAQAGDRAGGLAAIQRAVEIHEQLAEDNFAAYGPDLAMSLNNLSIRLAQAGERAKGLAAIQRAVQIYEQLAEDNFAAYGPVLAQSLNNLSIDLAEAGDNTQKTMEICTKLEKIKQQILDQKIQVPASHAYLFE